ncbi:hypothetical protein LNTAR_25310 [Lentisphaera araneosa HTCC2155]|uniref:Uncharacterized protein n=1 Tax=Lentisphaera araneosa HTCC2155 TaxID=313628 RepID=A6DSA4_9BACT|nr:hypothetical protein [Lentisphaera araneosa]EDM25449.1 hypothetical protein LNTAR_25310 [Lentisphaera araneosa HTCC2155]
MIKNFIKTFALVASLASLSQADEAKNIAGVYPSLTMYNNEGECGTGAVVPWGDSLWVITYAPHKPSGSSDKLYQITPELKQIIRPESVGGTPANRLIHKESEQLNIGPYFIKKDGTVRTLDPKKMPGRHTGTARHLTDPENKVYIATMEEGLYSVDVDTLEFVEHIKDGNNQAAVGNGVKSKLPGYHGKGLYSGQDFLIYANNGEHGRDARTRPDTSSGALASWQGKGDWKLIRRNQFTEVTGPGGIYGNANDSDPIWAMGWDYRSLILMLLQDKKWHAYRLPKASHSYDGAHGWNTEWPRIRDIEEKDLLATMHGTFWKFPKTFSKENSAGIAPRSNYLKVIGDFSMWKDKLILGCDDSAQKEFLNHRPFKSTQGAPTQSNSNLWFIDPAQLDQMGPVIGRGSVWLRDDVKANQVSDPYLFSGYDYRNMVITHKSGTPVKFTIEIDKEGNNTWTKLAEFKVNKSLIHQFSKAIKGTWIRVKAQSDAKELSIHFNYSNKDLRSPQNDAIFAPIAKIGETQTSKGLIRSNRKVLSLQNDKGFFTVNANLELNSADDQSKLFKGAEQPQNMIKVDEASALIIEDGNRYRIPKNDAYKNIEGRICREVATERDLFNFHGTFYELPARNAQGFAKIRPISTHNLAIDDYASHFGLMFMTGLTDRSNDRVIKNDHAAVWAGVIDELWKLGKPRGFGGPWKETQVKAGVPSDPYLMTGYDKKSVELSSDKETTIKLEVDIDGTGLWVEYKKFELKAGQALNHTFPEGFSAYWVRATSTQNAKVTSWFIYK